VGEHFFWYWLTRAVPEKGHTMALVVVVQYQTSCNDQHDIVSKKNSLCGQINNVLCYFGRHDPITKLRLMRTYCSSFYGSVLLDLTNPSVE